MGDTKKLWKEIVTPEDYDAHKIEAGQASINAKLVKKMFQEFPLPPQSLVYVPGCGTGQLFDFLEPKELGDLRYLFSDIKPAFTEELKKRLPMGTSFQITIDDIKESKINQKVDAAVVVLLLQHVDWKRALTNIISCNPTQIFLIEQEQDAADKEINQNRELRPTIKKFSEVAKTELISRRDLEAYVVERGYQLSWLKIESVPYQKRMFAMVFTSNGIRASD